MHLSIAYYGTNKMILKKSVINILRMLEVKKIKNNGMILKKLMIENNNNIQQLNILSSYQSDYYIAFFKKLKVGMSNFNWNNYVNFIEILNQGIKKQKEINMVHKIKIKQHLLQLFYMYNKTKLWKTLNNTITSDILKKRIALDQVKIDELCRHNIFYNK